MLKYSIVIINDSSPSFCLYNKADENNYISRENLKEALLWSVKENLEIQIALPDSNIPSDLYNILDSISYTKIASVDGMYRDIADILIIDSYRKIPDIDFQVSKSYIARIESKDFQDTINHIFTKVQLPQRINFVFTDKKDIQEEWLINKYEVELNSLRANIVERFRTSHKLLQCNLLTDRLFLKQMNNCNAGYESITIAPNGAFYICPAFYYNHKEQCGDLKKGLNIKNKQLYSINNAPICQHCNAFQCSRCIWINERMTHEVNTPPRSMCITSNIERRVSSRLLNDLRSYNVLSEIMVENIPELDYLDPLDNIKNWN